MKCEIKTGFFILKQCENNSEQTCSNCNRHSCKNHSEKVKRKIYCPECYYKKHLATKKETPKLPYDSESQINKVGFWLACYQTHHSELIDFEPFGPEDYAAMEQPLNNALDFGGYESDLFVDS